MRRTFICILGMMCFVCLCEAQITTSHVAPKQTIEPIVPPFDSTRNFLFNDNVKSYIGQSLYVNGKSKLLRDSGYKNFRTEKEPSNKSDKWGEPAKSNPNNTKFEDLYGKCFVVRDVQPDSKQRDKWWFQLQNKDVPEEVVWFEYDGLYFPFITVSYFNYLKNTLVGKKYVLKYNVNENGVCETWVENKDFNTGESFVQKKEDRWECTEITIEDEFFSLVALIKNQRGNVAAVETGSLIPADGSHQCFEESIFNTLVNKYGAGNIDNVRQGKIRVGMPKALLLMSWGEPDKINRSSHGPDQWVYGYQYVYVQNGKITAWN